MISKYKYTIVLLIFAAFFIFGSMEVMDYILRIRETQLLTESGRVEMESPVRTWESWENDKEGIVSEDIASEGNVLKIEQIEDAIKCWNERNSSILLYQRNLPREEVKSAAGYILKEGMRLESLSLKLMDLFVLDKQEFILEKMSVREMFENLEQGIEPVCRKHGAILHMEIEDGIIRVDYDLFKTMILNLADNALKADCRDVWVEGKQDGNIYQIRIKDNGKGIPPEELERITEAFYMVDKSRSRKQHGAGIGMALVSKIVEVHGAKMEIESDGKTGTQIYLNFVAGGEENDK